MTFSKPYKLDYRRPDDAEVTLTERIKNTLNEITSMGIDEDDISIGFLDEASPQNKANSGKTWHFPDTIFKENSTKIKTNTIGFYSLNGYSVVRFLESSNEFTIKWFLKEVRDENQDSEYIIIILDNLSSHKCKRTIDYAKSIGIYLVFLTPYSPDLNPIEFVWKSIRRVVSQFFIQNADHLREIIYHCYMSFTETTSFAKNWIKQFIKPIFNKKKDYASFQE
jgi:transposase